MGAAPRTLAYGEAATDDAAVAAGNGCNGDACVVVVLPDGEDNAREEDMAAVGSSDLPVPSCKAAGHAANQMWVDLASVAAHQLPLACFRDVPFPAAYEDNTVHHAGNDEAS